MSSESKGKNPGSGHVRSHLGLGHASSAAAFLLKHIEADKYHAHLIPSFISALASMVEARINEAIIDYFYFKCGANYRGFAKGVLAIPLKERIAFTPALLSDFDILLNEKHPQLHIVFRLLELRNTLVHIKPHWFPAKWDDDSLEYLKPQEVDPLSKLQGLFEFPRETLRGYSEAANSLVYDFRRLESRIRKARFRPEPWFRNTESEKRVKKTRRGPTKRRNAVRVNGA